LFVYFGNRHKKFTNQIGLFLMARNGGISIETDAIFVLKFQSTKCYTLPNFTRRQPSAAVDWRLGNFVCWQLILGGIIGMVFILPPFLDQW
jgi:hypothetical protein